MRKRQHIKFLLFVGDELAQKTSKIVVKFRLQGEREGAKEKDVDIGLLLFL